MKAHITAQMPPHALFYGLPEETARALQALLEEMQIGARQILPAELNQPVGLLAGYGGKARAEYNGEAPDVQLLLLSGLERGVLNRLLDRMREENIRIPLKAVVTKHNKSWSVLELLLELGREHEAVQQYEQQKETEK